MWLRMTFVYDSEAGTSCGGAWVLGRGGPAVPGSPQSSPVAVHLGAAWPMGHLPFTALVTREVFLKTQKPEIFSKLKTLKLPKTQDFWSWRFFWFPSLIIFFLPFSLFSLLFQKLLVVGY